MSPSGPRRRGWFLSRVTLIPYGPQLELWAQVLERGNDAIDGGVSLLLASSLLQPRTILRERRRAQTRVYRSTLPLVTSFRT
jgi:hypothetical protein